MCSIEGGSIEFVQFQLRLFQAFDRLGMERAIEASVPIKETCPSKDDFEALIQRTNSLGYLNSYEHQGGNPPRKGTFNTAGVEAFGKLEFPTTQTSSLLASERFFSRSGHGPLCRAHPQQLLRYAPRSIPMNSSILSAV